MRAYKMKKDPLTSATRANKERMLKKHLLKNPNDPTAKKTLAELK